MADQAQLCRPGLPALWPSSAVAAHAAEGGRQAAGSAL